METTESKPAGRLQRLQAYRQEHAKAEIAAFFAAGCLFDIVTLTRIDNVANLVQLGLYLVVLSWLMLLDERYSAGVGSPPRWLRGAWRFSEDVIHFLLGSLLSVFTLFYLKSTSGVASFVFLGLLGTLLVANELPGFREHGPIVRFGLLGLTLTTYLLLLLPILFGFLSVWLFVAAVILSSAAIGWLARTLVRWTGDLPAALRRLAAPALGMQALLILANVGGLIPPAPLSVQYIGIYHEVIPPGAQEARADDSTVNASPPCQNV